MRPRPIACLRSDHVATRFSFRRPGLAGARAARWRSRPWPCSARAWPAPAKPARQRARGRAPVVELYTSEGCNSCPPADRWLSKLKADPTVVALAFHVDYWDRLGWKDRFASAAFTQRQAASRRRTVPASATRRRSSSMARPHRWAAASPGAGSRPAAPVDVARRTTATASSPRRPRRGRAEAARGVLGRHRAGPRQRGQGGRERGRDAASRFRRPRLRAGGANGRAQRRRETLRFKPATPSDPAHPRDVNLVVVDAATVARCKP